jgi:hypothetical protein
VVTDSATPPVSTPVTLTLTIAPAPLTVTTTALPAGQVGQPYTGGLAASGGTGALHWALAPSQQLPAGLNLDPSNGQLSGTPTGQPSSGPIGFVVTDSATPPVSTPVTLTLTIAPAVGAPTLTGASPTTGPASGGTLVLLHGTNLAHATTVTIGGKRVPFAPTPAGTTIYLLTPPHPGGAVPIVVTDVQGLSNAVTFTYQPVAGTTPRVNSLSPTTGRTSGGTWVQLHGANLQHVTKVTLDGARVPFIATPDGQTIYLLTPHHAAGPVPIVVTTPTGTTTPVTFSYQAPTSTNSAPATRTTTRRPPS